MKFSRLLPLAAALVLAACATPYTKFRVTNYRGDLVADWIAEGFWHRSGDMYRIKAVERTSGPPYSQTTQYPNGWRTLVGGPHIVHWRTGKPLWLYHLDRGPVVVEQTHVETTTVTSGSLK